MSLVKERTKESLDVHVRFTISKSAFLPCTRGILAMPTQALASRTTEGRGSPAAVLDRLAPDSGHALPRAAWFLPLWICACSTFAVRCACCLIDVAPWPYHSVRLAGEVVAALYLTDLVSGIFHVTLDFADVGLHLRHTLGRTRAQVHAIRRLDPRFRVSSTWNQLVWNFQVHHAAPYPEHDNQLIETACIATPLLLLTVAQRTVGWLADGPWRVWLMMLLAAHFVQTSHFLAHRRVHLGQKSLPHAVCVLQDVGLLLSPRAHRRHHETFDCNVPCPHMRQHMTCLPMRAPLRRESIPGARTADARFATGCAYATRCACASQFCIFNGWANPVVNAGFRLARLLGFVDPNVTLQVK